MTARGPDHGTPSSYRRERASGAVCEVCRAQETARRNRYKGKPGSPAPHLCSDTTSTGYDDYACRSEECKAGKRASRRKP